MLILGVETSCDDTCVAVVNASGTLERPRFRVLSSVVSSQVKVHRKYGGVVPSLAAREHAKNIAPVLRRAIQAAGRRLQDMDLFAVTTHPGLMPALVVGVHAARTLAWYCRKPILGINHLEAHLVANWLSPNPTYHLLSTNYFPALGLIVSGGHTQLVLMKKLGQAKVVGETRDDAAGEAFDKVAKMLGLPFPGGPPIAKLATRGNPAAFALPRPMMHSNDLDFSFSGLKTAVLYLLRDDPRAKKADVAASFQQAAVDTLVAKTLRAAKKYKAKTVMLGGGVAANLELRKQLGEALAQKLPATHYSLPTTHFALDNGAMIAATAYLHWLRGKRTTWKQVTVRV